MFDIPLLINPFISLIEIKKPVKKNPIKEHIFLSLVNYLFNWTGTSIKNIK